MAASSLSALIGGEALEGQQLLLRQRVEVGRIGHEASLCQLPDGALAEPLDVHRAA